MTRADVRRILVALDASPHSDAALQEAAALAAPLEAELAGIFVLDTELLRLAALPAASETGLTSAQRRPLNPETMTRALKAQADRARRSLEAVARRHRLQASFQLLQGNVLAEILKAVKKTDLLAMGVVGQMNVTRQRLGSTVRGVTTRAGCSVLLMSPTTPARAGTVVTVFCASGHAQRALALAQQLASRRDSELVVLIDASAEPAEALEARARAQLDTADVQVRFETIEPGNVPGLKTALERHNGGILVLANDCELLEGRTDAICSLAVPVLLAGGATD